MKEVEKYDLFWRGAFCGVKDRVNGRIIVDPIYDGIDIRYYGFVVKIQGKAGIVKFSGKYLIEPNFHGIEDFVGGYARVSHNYKYGLIHKSGRIVIEPKYGYVGLPSNGLIRVAVTKDEDNSNYGFIDEMGTMIIDPQYSFATDFNDGIACVVLKDYWVDEEVKHIEKIGYINKKNELIIEFSNYRAFNYDDIYESKYGLCRVDFYDYIDSKFKCGFIDITGKEVIKKIYEDFLSPYKNIIPAKKDGKWGIIDLKGFTIFYFNIDEIGVLHTQPDSPEWHYNLRSNFPVRIGKKWGFIDFKGNIVIPFKYEEYKENGYFLENYYILRKRSKWGVIDEQNEVIIPFIYNDISYWDDLVSLLKVRKGNKWGFLNLQGREIIPIKYDKVGRFENGIARIELKGKRGYIDSKGNLIVKIKYIAEEYDFFEKVDFNFSKFFRVNLNGKYGVIDSSNHYLIQPNYDELIYSENDMWLFKLNGRYGFVNVKGLLKQSDIFDDAKNFSEGLAAVKRNNSWGFIDYDFNLVITFKYQDVKDFWNGFAAVKIEGLWGFINKRGNIIIECKYNEVSRFNDGSAKCDDFYVDLDDREMSPHL